MSESELEKKIVDRVVFCLTKNELYIDFWNYISKLYRVKYNITPTLFFSGDDNDLKILKGEGRLSVEFGEVYLLPRVLDIPFDGDMDWTCTWGLFYGAAQFPDDICMLSGIDQIPLNNKLLDYLKRSGYRDSYTVLWSDAYGANTGLGKMYPSSHHIAKGKFFKKLYKIDDSWSVELLKVFNSSSRLGFEYPFNCNNFWGLDEAYSSWNINEYVRGQNMGFEVVLMKNIFHLFKKTRLDRGTSKIYLTDFDVLLNEIKSGLYCEYHARRPFALNTRMGDVLNAIQSHSNIL